MVEAIRTKISLSFALTFNSNFKSYMYSNFYYLKTITLLQQKHIGIITEYYVLAILLYINLNM